VITPVDAPPVSLETLRALTEALADEAADAVTPRYGDDGGHPVVCRAPVLSPYGPSATPPLPPLRDVLRALGPRRLRLPLPDPCIPLDLDTPADVLAVTGAPAAFLPR
jgi:CTP:molybdopterin cytidylyltransferase MocA